MDLNFPSVCIYVFRMICKTGSSYLPNDQYF